LGPIAGLIAVISILFSFKTYYLTFETRIYARLECRRLRCQTCSRAYTPGFQVRLRCQCVRCVQYCSRCRKVSQCYTSHSCLFNPCFLFRLWMSQNTGGSIVITCSMSSQIINRSAEAEPLTQVRISTFLAALHAHILKIFFPFFYPRFSINLQRLQFQT
jgi:hypothetical protein